MCVIIHMYDIYVWIPTYIKYMNNIAYFAFYYVLYHFSTQNQNLLLDFFNCQRFGY